MPAIRPAHSTVEKEASPPHSGSGFLGLANLPKPQQATYHPYLANQQVQII